jgi:hypothetical protein
MIFVPAALALALSVASARAQHSAIPIVCSSIGVRVSPMTAALADSLGMTEIYPAAPLIRSGQRLAASY